MAQATSPYRLHVAIDRGQGPVYVLLHGINSTGHDWDTVVTAMGFDRHCIALDELGYGNSPKPLDIEYTVDDHADAIVATLDDLGINEPFTLVGYSMGGPMAVRLAAKYPQLVRRLVLISAPFFLDADQMGDSAYAKAVFQTMGSQKVLDLVRSAGFATSNVFKKFSADDKKLIQGFINSEDLDTDWHILQKNMANGIQRTNFAENLSAVVCPVTFMVGEHDAFIVQSQIETLARDFAPNMEVRFLADLKADHMLLQNIPTMMADEITRFEDRRLSIAFDRGEGPLILMLHGIENDGSFWNQAALALATRNRVVALDLLGFGRSPKPTDIPYTVDNHVESIELTLDSLLRDPDQPLTIVGHSIGAIISAAFARKHPERITRLVMFSVPVNERDVEAGSGRLDQARAVFVDNFGPLREKGLKLANTSAVRGVLGRERLSRYTPTLRSLANTIEVEHVGEDLRACPDVPVTLVYGTRDPFVVPEYIEALAASREGAETVRLEAGHDIATQMAPTAVRIIDPEVPEQTASELAAKALKDPKLRPNQSSWAGLFAQDNALIIFRALLYLALGGSMLFLPPSGDVQVLRIAFAIFMFARSISFITSVFTTQSIQQERFTNAASGIAGIAVGIFLMLAPNISAAILAITVAGYLVVNAVVNLFAAFYSSHKSRRRRLLAAQGLAELAAAALLLAGSTFTGRVIMLLIMVGSIASGVSLLTYVGVTARLGKAFDATSE
ncbi:MAG: alpha/beta fold hydrolase [Coriobacteriia bacterium]|nr:alpha/beta fold hydrolase [Coriobacteriia bacterium]